MQEQVNATFVSTVAEAVMKAGNALSMANASGQVSVTGSLDSVKAQLQDYVVMLQSFQSIMSSAEMIILPAGICFRIWTIYWRTDEIP